MGHVTSAIDGETRRRKADLRLPPGPKGHFLVGVLPEIKGDWLGFLTRCNRQYGDIFYFRLLTLHCCHVDRPDYIESVLVTNQQNFIKSVDYRALGHIFGNGLLTSEGEFWRRQRRLAQPAFHRERVGAYSGLMVDYAERALADWREGQTRDVHQDMMKLTLEIVAQALFGAEVAGVAKDIGAALELAMEHYLARSTTAFLIPNFVPTPLNLRLRKAVRRLDEIIYGIIRRRRAAGRDTGDLLSMLLHARDEDDSRMTDKQLRDEVMTLLLAGHETTANALSWTWYLLAQHPEVESRLRTELRETLGGRSPALNDVPRLRYTEKVVKESMRLYPPAWGIGRQAIHAFEMAGYRLPAGTNVFMSQWIVQHDPRYFEDPERFNPDRWTDEFEKRLPKFAYFPFGGGPRLCIGAPFAMLESVLLLATIAQRFRLVLEPDHPVELLPSITLRPKHGIKVVLERSL